MVRPFHGADHLRSRPLAPATRLGRLGERETKPTASRSRGWSR